MLFGRGKSGKTSTIKAIYDSLKLYSNVLNYEEVGNADTDICCLLEYRNKRVALYSMGDYSNYICERMDESADNGCSIFVCACNDRLSRPLKRIRRYKGSRVISKTLCSTKEDQVFTNMEDVRIVIELINEMIKE